MREKIIEIIKGINEDILSYEGNTMLEDGIVDSFEIINLVSELEEEFDIEIDARYVVAENFNNTEGIIKVVEKVMGK